MDKISYIIWGKTVSGYWSIIARNITDKAWAIEIGETDKAKMGWATVDVVAEWEAEDGWTDRELVITL